MIERIIDWMAYMEELKSDEFEQPNLPPRRLRKKEYQKNDSREGRIVRKKQLKFHHFLSSFLVVIFIPIPILFVLSVYRPEFIPFLEKDEIVNQSNFETIKMDEKNENTEIIKENDTVVEDDVEEQDEVEEIPIDNENYEYYTVKKGDTIYKLSMEFYGDRSGEDIIMTENNLTSRELEEGTAIRIPKNKSM